MSPLVDGVPVESPRSAFRASYPPVRTKADASRRYRNGEWGNASPSWATPEVLREYGPADPASRYHLRNARVPGGASHYGLAYGEALTLWSRQEDPAGWYASLMASHDRTLLQGEVERAPFGLSLYYSTLRTPMRVALREEGRSASGIVALSLLRQHLCPNSYDWLDTLLDRYPGHVVEFSAFEREWGTLPGYNTVFWEVRSY